MRNILFVLLLVGGLIKETYTPAGSHDPQLCDRVRSVFNRLTGMEGVAALKGMMGGEDFSRFPRYWNVPGLQFRLGAAPKGHDPRVGLHSRKWVADPEPTLRMGTMAFAAAMGCGHGSYLPL